MYLVHYADHDATCRNLALLSINAFQRGLSDSEQWIRALALRVLTSIRVNDVIQIQILAVQTCTKDSSRYVRKCASNALGKLYPRLAGDQENEMRILDIMKELLLEESSTMVLASFMYSFCEICPGRLDMLHGCYRKLCHLLTDMDEWGQVIVMDVLSRYCRTYFRKPTSGGGEIVGSAEAIDRQRRIVRRLDQHGITTNAAALDDEIKMVSSDKKEKNNTSVQTTTKNAKRIKVKKGFYSDDEDDSSEEDLIPQSAILAAKNQSVASSMRQRKVLGFGGGISGVDGNYGPHGVGGLADATGAVDEDSELDEDHSLLLRSSLPLLKSRNSAVVLGVCSLHYYCGVASIKIRSALGKSLVRIYHDRREIQFVVLNSIRMLVWECPSAFTPFLNNFFVKAMDPSFTRLIKLDILSALALAPNSINALLKEFRTYIRHDDKDFVCASIKAVGKIVEMAKIVYDRQGEKTGNLERMREEANIIALNCLHGILTLIESSSHKAVVGESIGVAQRIIVLLQSSVEGADAKMDTVTDPHHVQMMSLRRLVLLVLASLAAQQNIDVDKIDEEEEKNEEEIALQNQTLTLPTESIGAALWIIGECLCSDNSSRSYIKIFRSDKEDEKLIISELLRLLAKFFPDMDPALKCHCIHFVSKTIISNDTVRNGQSRDKTFCEYILALGRVDTNQDVRDRSRNESLVIHASVGIQYDVETLPSPPMDGTKITIENARSMLLKKKPSSSWLPIQSDKPNSGNDENGISNPFRFGTLSSMVSHKAGSNYMPLPLWADEDSPKTLRDPVQTNSQPKTKQSTKKKRGKTNNVSQNTMSGFYDSGSNDSSSSDSDSDDSTSGSSSSSSDSDSSSSSDDSDSDSSSDDSSDSVSDESTSSEESGNDPRELSQPQSSTFLPMVAVTPAVIEPMKSIADSSDEGSSSDDESDSDASSANSDDKMTNVMNKEPENVMGSLIDVSYNKESFSTSTYHRNGGNNNSKPKNQSNDPTTSVTAGLEGLVMAPLKIDKEEVNTSNGDTEDESSDWEVLVNYELSGGLSAKARFLRHNCRKQELLLLGLDPKNAAVVCVQIKFENKRTDGRGIRRIKLLQRKVSTSGVIPTSRVVIPQEIDMLNSSQMSYAMVGLEFAQVSDKDGAILSRFDIKCDRSSTSVDIRPPLAELLTVNRNQMSIADFDESMQKMHGIHQQAVIKFDLSSISEESGSGISSLYKQLPSRILNVSTLTLVGKKEWNGSTCRFAASLPASGKDVLVKIQCDKKTGTGELTICCDSATALSSLLRFLKKAILS